VPSIVTHDVVIVGLSHHTAPVQVREQLALGVDGRERLLHDLLALEPVREAVVLSTCNRVEAVTCCHPETDPVPGLTERLLLSGGDGAVPYSQVAYAEAMFNLRGREAVRHVFRVASSLDSLVLGEPQILGQMKEQFGLCEAAKSVGPVLHRVFHKGFSVAKRVRSETGVASRAVSVASSAVDLASKIFESLEDRVVLLIGVGEMGEAAVRSLVAAGASRVMVANRTFESAVTLARRFSGTPVPLERLRMYLPLADLVIGSAGGGQLVDAAEVRRVMRERRSRPAFFIDLAVPRNFDPRINDLDNVYLFDIDDLADIVEENIGERQREAIRGEAIVEQEVDRFWQWFEKLEVVPTIVELREFAETVRAGEVERTLGKLDQLAEGDRERIDSMTRAIVNKLLHEPTAALRQSDTPETEFMLLGALRELFKLGKKGSG
jgi:glutamyl-tRNA reductase